MVVSAITLGVLGAPAIALAHPLGNFTINTSAALVVRADEVVVDHVVDIAEIPTLQERRRLDPDGDGAPSAEEAAAYRSAVCGELRAGLRLRIDGVAAPLTLRSSNLALPAGQAGLSTLRLRCVFASAIDPAPVHDLSFEDRTYPDRLGWREVTAAGDGATIVRSDVPSESPSDRLRSYPTGVTPSDVRTASLTFRPGGAPLRC